MNKKILFSLGSISAVALPIASVACSKTSSRPLADIKADINAEIVKIEAKKAANASDKKVADKIQEKIDSFKLVLDNSNSKKSAGYLETTLEKAKEYVQNIDTLIEDYKKTDEYKN